MTKGSIRGYTEIKDGESKTGAVWQSSRTIDCPSVLVIASIVFDLWRGRGRGAEGSTEDAKKPDVNRIKLGIRA